MVGTNSELAEIRHDLTVKKARKLGILAIYAVAFAGIFGWLTGYIAWPTSGNAETAREEPSNTVANPTEDTARPKMIDAKVVAVSSGDTMTVVDSNDKQMQVRLAGAAAPLEGQPFAAEARDRLSSLVLNKSVRIVPLKIEDSGDVLGKVLADGEPVNLAMINSGFAWHHKFSKYQSDEDREQFANAEIAARQTRKGIWSSAHPVAPWDFLVGTSGPPVEPAERAAPPAAAAPRIERRESAKPRGFASVIPPKEASPAVSLTIADVPLKAPSPAPVSRPQNTSAAEPKSGGGSGKYTLGPRGGCYYITASGSKMYVDKSLCGQ